MRIFCLILLLPFLSVAQFTPDSMGHVGDARFKTFLKTNNIQLCGAFRGTVNREKKVFYFAQIVKDSTPMYMDLNGNIYTDGKEIRNVLDLKDEYEPVNRRDESIGFDVPVESLGTSERAYNYEYGSSKQFTENGKKGYIFNNRKILPAIYDEIQLTLYPDQPFIVVTLNGRKGIADTTGKILIEPQYDDIQRSGSSSASQKLYYKMRDGGEEGFLDHKGAVTIPLQPYHMTYRKEYIELSTGNYPRLLLGIMDTTGKIVIPPAFTYLSPVTKYLNGGKAHLYDAIVVGSGSRNKQKKGLMDFKGNLLLDTVYSEIKQFRRDLYSYSVEKEGKTLSGIYDVKAKKVILPAEYSIDDYLFEDTVLISRIVDGKKRFGLLTGDGKILVPADYNYVHYLRGQQLLILGTEQEYILTDLDRNRVVRESYEEIVPLQEFMHTRSLPSDQLRVKTNGKYGTIDVKGNIVIPAEYDKISPNNFGIMAQKGKHTYFLNPKGQVLFSTGLDVRQFANGIFEATNSARQTFYCDLYGNELQMTHLRWR